MHRFRGQRTRSLMDRALGYGPRGCGFDSRRVHQFKKQKIKLLKIKIFGSFFIDSQGRGSGLLFPLSELIKGVYIHVYPKCRFISVNMYITVYVFSRYITGLVYCVMVSFFRMSPIFILYHSHTCLFVTGFPIPMT